MYIGRASNVVYSLVLYKYISGSLTIYAHAYIYRRAGASSWSVIYGVSRLSSAVSWVAPRRTRRNDSVSSYPPSNVHALGRRSASVGVRVLRMQTEMYAW